MGSVMTKSAHAIYEQQRHRSACASSQCEQCLCDLSQLMTKPTKWYVRPAKTQISLSIHPIWSVFAVHMKKAWVLSYPLSVQWRPIRLGKCPGWSESSLVACHFVGFVMRRFICCLDSLMLIDVIFKSVCSWADRLESNLVTHLRRQVFSWGGSNCLVMN